MISKGGVRENQGGDRKGNFKYNHKLIQAHSMPGPFKKNQPFLISCLIYLTTLFSFFSPFAQ